ncbi:hypothetical protein Pmani_013311 [Petrolisthes manimaculis]|uniref:Uncharacterized protein n=1 Tax=Petrolisthes manimaculis TaxID=1843537 RepID=A0AAE1UE37_9EUCA|nr:hypothetical protein Pmani_013311 [Petrolisthes manimaculis]
MAPKTKFLQDWLLNQEFQPWLSQVEGDTTKAFCNAYKRTLGAEITSIKRHKTSQHYIVACRESNQQKVQLDNPPPPAPGGHVVAMATIFFACFIAEHNLPFTTADHLIDLMKVMFPDSQIAQSMFMKRSKCTEAVKVIGKCAINDTLHKLKTNHFFIIIDEIMH